MSKRRGRLVPKTRTGSSPARPGRPEDDAPLVADSDLTELASYGMEMRARPDPDIFRERSDVLPDDEPVDDVNPHRVFEPTLDVGTEQPSEKQLHRLMKDWRHGRATRTIMQALSDAYVALITVLILGAMAISVLVRAQAIVSTCNAGACLSARTAVPWAVLAGAGAIALAVSRLFGPVLASAAEGFWLMDAPIRRSQLLGSRLTLIVVLSGVAGGVLGALTATLTGSSGQAIVAWTVATLLVTAGLVAFAAAEQGVERSRWVRTAQVILALVAVAALGLVVAIAAGWLSLTLSPDRTVQIASVIAAVGAVVLLTSLLLAFHRLENIHRARLVSGGSLISGMQGAMFALDFGLVRDILVEREAIERGHVRPTRGRGLGISALVWRDLQRLVRFPRPLFVLAGTLVVPYAVDALGAGRLNPFLSALALMAALVPFLGSLRVLTRTGGLARSLPFPTSTIKTAAMAVPAVLALVWGLAATPAFMGVTLEGTHHPLLPALEVSLLTAAAGLLAAVRWVSAKQVNFNTPMVATQAGALPPGLIGNLLKGLDIAVLVTAPLLLGLSPLWSLVIAGIAFVVLRGSFSQQELLLRQEEQKKEMEKFRAEQAERRKQSAGQRRR